MLATLKPGERDPVCMRPDESDLFELSQTDVQDTTLPMQLLPAPAAPGARPLVHGPIPVSARFWFAAFDGERPDADALNVEDGRGVTHFLANDGSEPDRVHWFCIDDDLVYLSFSNDWGPLNIAMFYRFCVHVHQMLIDPDMSDTHLVLYTNTHPHNKANAALLCALYAMTIDHISPADAFHPYSEIEFKPFRDAGYGRADFSLTIQDILYGLHRALEHKLLDLTTFDLESYEHYEQVQNGDWNWITPHFLAFASPKDKAYLTALSTAGSAMAATSTRRAPLHPLMRHTIDYFRDNNIGLVVRLNNPLYNRAVFEDAGMKHLDLYFDDGSNPSDEILRSFIREADRTIGAGKAIAVHCKAGLGRTGVLIGAYLIWKHGFTAAEIIGYMRLMRPGCVVGPQQHFMYENAAKWVCWGVEDRLRAEMEERVAARPPLAEVTQTPTSKPVAVPASAPVHHIKPTPVVGQPRKTPGPKRRRGGEDDPLLPQAKRVVSDSSSPLHTRSQGDAPDSREKRLVSDESDAQVVDAQLARTDAEVLGAAPLDSSAAPTPSPRAPRGDKSATTPAPAPRLTRTPLRAPGTPAATPVSAASPSTARTRRTVDTPSPARRRAMAPTTTPSQARSPVHTDMRSSAAKPVLARAHARVAGRNDTENVPPRAGRTVSRRT